MNKDSMERWLKKEIATWKKEKMLERLARKEERTTAMKQMEAQYAGSSK